MLRHFQMFADYNRWANARVYDACAALSDEQLREDKGAFFKSALHTLNHLLVADRIWMHRLTGTGERPASLDQILHDDLATLRAAREAEDTRIMQWLNQLSEAELFANASYSPFTLPDVITQPCHRILAHVFNHQTHHRAQVHVILTALGQPSLVLDLIYFQRGDGKRWLEG